MKFMCIQNQYTYIALIDKEGKTSVAQNDKLHPKRKEKKREQKNIKT